jgi:hypothetical protein
VAGCEAGGISVPGFPVLGGSISMAAGLRKEGFGGGRNRPALGGGVWAAGKAAESRRPGWWTGGCRRSGQVPGGGVTSERLGFEGVTSVPGCRGSSGEARRPAFEAGETAEEAEAGRVPPEPGGVGGGGVPIKWVRVGLRRRAAAKAAEDGREVSSAGASRLRASRRCPPTYGVPGRVPQIRSPLSRCMARPMGSYNLARVLLELQVCGPLAAQFLTKWRAIGPGFFSQPNFFSRIRIRVVV